MRNTLPPFLRKLKVITDSTPNDIAGWDDSGNIFGIRSERFADVLAKHFKGNKQTFIRQLHFYGFKKLDVGSDSTLWAFSHPSFQRDCPHLIYEIKRKTRTETGDTTASASEVQLLRDQVGMLQTTISNMELKMNFLMSKLGGGLEEEFDEFQKVNNSSTVNLSSSTNRRAIKKRKQTQAPLPVPLSNSGVLFSTKLMKQEACDSFTESDSLVVVKREKVVGNVANKNNLMRSTSLNSVSSIMPLSISLGDDDSPDSDFVNFPFENIFDVDQQDVNSSSTPRMSMSNVSGGTAGTSLDPKISIKREVESNQSNNSENENESEMLPITTTQETTAIKQPLVGVGGQNPPNSTTSTEALEKLLPEGITVKNLPSLLASFLTLAQVHASTSGMNATNTNLSGLKNAGLQQNTSNAVPALMNNLAPLLKKCSIEQNEIELGFKQQVSPKSPSTRANKAVEAH